MQTIYYHGNIITMDESYPTATAICVENGKIIAVGQDQEILALKKADSCLVDLKQKTMLPGFIDPHSHFFGVADALSQCDLSQVTSFEQIIVEMKKFIQENNIQPGQWVYGNGYDHNFLVEKKHPNKFILDQISTVHPIVLIHASSHIGTANSLALKLQHIDEKTPDPNGGKFYRIENSNEPNGFMEENAFIHFRNQLPMKTVDELMKLVVKAQDIYAQYGITTMQEGMVAKPLFDLLHHAASLHLLKLDLVGYLDIDHHFDLIHNELYRNKYTNHFKIGGFKVFLDGSPQGKTAWISRPYLNEKDYCGYPTLKDEHLYHLIELSLKEQQQLLAHCNGDAAAEQYLTQFEKVMKQYPYLDTKRPVMVHAQLVRKDQLKRMLPLNMMPSFFIAHTYFWGDIHIENFGRERANHISPAKSALDLGIPFTFHQDSPVIPPDMMKTVWCAVNRQTKAGVTLGEDEKISVYDALKAITIHAAYQYFEEDTKGSITKGKIADLVILDKNPLTTNHQDLANIMVLETIKEGKTIYKVK